MQKDAELTRLDLPTVHIFGLKQIKVLDVLLDSGPAASSSGDAKLNDLSMPGTNRGGGTNISSIRNQVEFNIGF